MSARQPGRADAEPVRSTAACVRRRCHERPIDAEPTITATGRTGQFPAGAFRAITTVGCRWCLAGVQALAVTTGHADRGQGAARLWSAYAMASPPVATGVSHGTAVSVHRRGPAGPLRARGSVCFIPEVLVDSRRGGAGGARPVGAWARVGGAAAGAINVVIRRGIRTRTARVFVAISGMGGASISGPTIAG